MKVKEFLSKRFRFKFVQRLVENVKDAVVGITRWWDRQWEQRAPWRYHGVFFLNYLLKLQRTLKALFPRPHLFQNHLSFRKPVRYVTEQHHHHQSKPKRPHSRLISSESFYSVSLPDKQHFVKRHQRSDGVHFINAKRFQRPCCVVFLFGNIDLHERGRTVFLMI